MSVRRWLLEAVAQSYKNAANVAASPNSTGGDSDSEYGLDVNINVMNDITDAESEPQAEDCDVGGDGVRSHYHAKGTAANLHSP